MSEQERPDVCPVHPTESTIWDPCELCERDYITKLQVDRGRFRRAIEQSAELIRAGNPTAAEIELRRCLIDTK